MPPSYTEQRQTLVNSLENEYFDLVIIGGGITGAGIALDAETRGLKVALIEQNDFASGTSSKSTKLIHGGLRYLKQFEFGLVREVGRERAILHDLATHLVRPEKMLLPLTKDGSYGKIIASVGLMVYDVLADVEKEDHRRMLSPQETMQLEPLLNVDKIEGGGLYSEYQTDDFRLVIELLKAAQNEGAKVMNYSACQDFIIKAGKIAGVKVHDDILDQEYTLYADYVINAAGPWSDLIRKNQEEVKGKKLHLTKGVHLVVPFQNLPIQQSVYFDVPDGRMMFAIPKKDVTYIGTTDTTFTGDLEDVRTTLEDVHYLLDAVNHYFPTVHLEPKDVISSWAGIRPLIEEEGKSASEISRKDEIFVSEHGLVTIAGGKLTGYRKMAKRAVETILEIRHEQTGKKIPKCKTKKYYLPGNSFKNQKAVKKYKKSLAEENPNTSIADIDYLVDLYGTQCEEILSHAKTSSIIMSEVRFCIEHEWVSHLTDFFIHRTGRLFFDIESVKSNLEVVAEEMSAMLCWSDEQKNAEIEGINREITKATVFE
ncbi:glycerol-3-phosphate dehydrogenase/oxidase [Reichenbachiella agarivorans]|uniref:Glycerol-3-phosphate dehydrogenase n=1 Tax=Reichenbachiella agarivorans TaxID=2979464 RepID=A0ABY6CYU2_9BACT|nr:glycerol-3-phosphate dehydrogenase/oxidase [Reichenbachiella agarivorans]UXP33405.1 glycerol-3-phosphate dehydrogenase/oxidase [Reichenbachiella agarivorans]